MEPSELGPTVRRWRDRVAPEAAGVRRTGRRRAPGLRREELAGLAAISVDYLTRLEQGRATSPSPQVLESLARALRLSGSERELLFRLAGRAAPGRELVSARIGPGVQRLLDRVAGTPVVVYDAMWNLVEANHPYEALMGETGPWRGIERNAVWRNLVGAPSRVVHTPGEHTGLVAGLVADLRLTAARYPADTRVQRLVGDLRTAGHGFERHWESGDLALDDTASRHKVVEHPTVGRIALDCDTLVVSGDDLRIMVYTAEQGTEDAERLSLATVLGTQLLAG